MKKVVSAIFLVAIKTSFRIVQYPLFILRRPYPSSQRFFLPDFSLPNLLGTSHRLSLWNRTPTGLLAGWLLCSLPLFFVPTVAMAEAEASWSKLPSLQHLVQRAVDRFSKNPVLYRARGYPDTRAELIHRIEKNYYQILARREQIEISKEVKGHFEKAVSKAEEKFEKGEGDVTQSALTKLKLGLAGTLNDINQFQSEIQRGRIHLEKLLGISLDPGFTLEDDKFKKVAFPYHTLEEFLKNQPIDEGSHTRLNSAERLSRDKRYTLEEGMIEVAKTRSQLELAQKNRKMTRALLVTEVANYDFGIGNEADLFEALIIYTRVLVGYFDAMLNFNVAVSELKRDSALP